MLGNFFKNYAKVNKDRIENGIVDIAASIDAEGVSETAIRQKMDEHDKIVKQLVEAKKDLQREKKEFEEAEKAQNKRIEAAKKAKEDLDKNPNDKTANKALTELLDAIEKNTSYIEREKRQFLDAQKFADEIETASVEIADQLKTLRSKLNEVKNEIKSAEIEAERARKSAERAEIVAGLKTSSNKFDTALNALQKQAEVHQKKTEEYRIKADQLSTPTEESSAVNKYMNNEPVVQESLEDRFNKLVK